ncbi:Ig-like domain-containing protein, partial [Yersinia proxima]
MKDICPSIECITVMPAAVNALADGNARVKFTAFYDDGLNLISTPTPEIVVNWMVDLNGGTLSSNTTRTNIYGETDITLQSVTAGLATVTATLNSNPKIFGSANVIFNSFEQNNFLKLVAIPQDSAPGDMVELNCYVQNDGDEPIDNIDIIWSTTDGFLTINEGKTNAIGMARNSLMHTNYGGVGVTVNIKNTDISALILIRYFNAHI